MSKYIDIVLTQDGYFCVAPPWVIKVGDLICLPDALSGDPKIHEVISVVTDEIGGDYVKQIERYIGHQLPKVTARYLRSEVEWDEPVQE